MHYIQLEIGKAERDEPCGIFLKMNSITDRELIDALVKAGMAGVPVKMIVRGICCLVPGIPGLTENICIHSIVGRFLEHARVFSFGDGADVKLFIASADWMTRNTENRVEVACPIEQSALKERIQAMLQLQFRDTRKGRRIGSDGRYHHIHPDTGINAQEQLMKDARNRSRKNPGSAPGY